MADTITYKGVTGKGAKKCLPMETGDLCGVARVIIDGSISRMGRPAEYPPTPEGLERFVQKTIDFFEHVEMVNGNADEKQKIIPDIELWCAFMGFTKVTLYNYNRRGGEWADVIGYYKECICAFKKQAAFRGKVPPVLAIFDLTNNHDYVSTSEFHLKTDHDQNEKTANDDYIRQAADMGLVWDDKTGKYIPMEVIE